jgi:hypothetical protein
MLLLLLLVLLLLLPPIADFDRGEDGFAVCSMNLLNSSKV